MTLNVGLVLPAANTTVESEFLNLLPDAGLVVSRFVPDTSSADACAAALHGAATAAGHGADVIAVCYATGSLLFGPEWDRELRDTTAESTRRPVVTAASALSDGLRHIGARDVLAVSPYSDEVNAALERWLREARFSVVAVRGSRSGAAPSRVPASEIEEMVAGANQTGADAVAVSCTGLRTGAIRRVLADAAGVPVVTSNAATAWAVARTAGENTSPAVVPESPG
ncbi:MAG: maleate cis-trans isomerase family protein [Acidimicrobiales bacterium]